MTWDLAQTTAVVAPVLAILGVAVWIGRWMQKVDASVNQIAEVMRVMATEKIRIDALERRVEDLRRGHGWIMDQPFERAYDR